jgi:hypothetical protein
VPVFVLHGDRDVAVPLQTARDAAARTRGTLVTVRGAGHSWLLRDPETMPAIVAQLLESGLDDACRAALRRAGVRKKNPTPAEVEAALYESDARIFALTPLIEASHVGGRHHRPGYRWTIETPSDAGHGSPAGGGGR